MRIQKNTINSRAGSRVKENVTFNGETCRHGAKRCMGHKLWLHKGIFLILLSCFLNALSAVCVKMMSGHIPSTEVVTLRLMSFAICASVCLVYKKVPIRLNAKQGRWLLLMVVLNFSQMMLAYYSYNNIPVGDSSAILYSNPIITALFAWLILREKLTLLDVLIALMTVSGIILIAKPSFILKNTRELHDQENTAYGVIASVASAACNAMVHVILRKLTTFGFRVHPLLQMWVYGTLGSLMGIIVTSILKDWTVPYCGNERLFLLLATFPGFLAQIFIMYAARYEKAAIVAIARTNTIVLAFLLDFAIRGAAPHYLSVIGAILILFSCLGIAYEKLKLRNNQMENEASRNMNEEEDKLSSINNKDVND